LGCVTVIADLYGDGFSPDSPDQVGPMVKNLMDHREQGVAAFVRVELYTQTHHAFDNPDAGSDPNARLVYSPTSARRATAAIASFVAEVIESERRGPRRPATL
jgi:dienelactone hydrolase